MGKDPLTAAGVIKLVDTTALLAAVYFMAELRSDVNHAKQHFARELSVIEQVAQDHEGRIRHLEKTPLKEWTDELVSPSPR